MVCQLCGSTVWLVGTYVVPGSIWTSLLLVIVGESFCTLLWFPFVLAVISTPLNVLGDALQVSENINVQMSFLWYSDLVNSRPCVLFILSVLGLQCRGFPGLFLNVPVWDTAWILSQGIKLG